MDLENKGHVTPDDWISYWEKVKLKGYSTNDVLEEVNIIIR